MSACPCSFPFVWDRACPMAHVCGGLTAVAGPVAPLLTLCTLLVCLRDQYSEARFCLSCDPPPPLAPLMCPRCFGGAGAFPELSLSFPCKQPFTKMRPRASSEVSWSVRGVGWLKGPLDTYLWSPPAGPAAAAAAAAAIVASAAGRSTGCQCRWLSAISPSNSPSHPSSWHSWRTPASQSPRKRASLHHRGRPNARAAINTRILPESLSAELSVLPEPRSAP